MNDTQIETNQATPEWHVRAQRLTPLIDGEEYYPVLRDALIRAREQVFIIGWDLHTEIDLLRGRDAEDAERHGKWPYRLADLLLAMVEANENLHIRLLIWEGSPLFVLERQHIPRMLWPWAQHPRIELVWDRDTPRLSSHHQKMVVIDDTLVFAGGMDLTAGRWDTHAHYRDDERRQMPGLLAKQGQPYHDVNLAMDDEVAVTLGDWARERWRRATGESVAPPEGIADNEDRWPPSLEPVLRDRLVEIHVTQPVFLGRPEKRQVEAAYLKQIREAERFIYIETQYLACESIVDVLCSRLREAGGPEVIVVLPHSCPGTLQAMCMDTQRDLMLDRLRKADTYDRFQAYWATLCGATVEDPPVDAVYIHAKTMVIDDLLMRVGSANLNNRSMGFDTELDLTVRIDPDDAAGKAAVTHYRQRLIAYLLNESPQTVAETEKAEGSVYKAVEALRGGHHTLHPFTHRASPLESAFALRPELADPDRPLTDLDADELSRVFEDYSRRGKRLRRRIAISVGMIKRKRRHLIAGAGMLLVIMVWTMTPLRDATDMETMRGWFDVVRASPLGMAGLGAAFVILATIGFPLTVLVAAAGALLAAGLAIPLCIIGVSVSAYLSYAIGQYAPRSLREFVDSRLPGHIRERLSNMSVVGVVILRHIPVAPFAVVNIACGIVGVPRGRFLVGNALGLLPGILLFTFLGQETMDMLANPSLANFAKVSAIGLLTIGVAFSAERLLRKLDRKRKAQLAGRKG